MTSDAIQVIQVKLDQLVEPPVNPNVMDEGDFRLLVHGIRESGFLQPLLVRPFSPDRWEIVDGVHRARAALEAGLTEVVVVVSPMDERRARLLQIGMNRLRGDLDLSAVARVVASLRIEAPDLDDLSLSGFDASEVDEMVRIAAGIEPDPIEDGMGAGPAEKPEGTPKPFSLELRFDTREDLARVKRSLRKAAGKGTPLEVGLMRIIDGALGA